AAPSTQPTLSLGAASARALCGRAHGRRTERHDKLLHPLRSTRPERQAWPPHLPEAAASESSFAISTALSAPEDDQIPEGRRGMGRWPRTRQYEEHRPAGG